MAFAACRDEAHAPMISVRISKLLLPCCDKAFSVCPDMGSREFTVRQEAAARAFYKKDHNKEARRFDDMRPLRILTLILLGASAPAFAASPWYIGAGFGAGHSENATINANMIAYGMTAPYGSYARSNTTLDVFGGYRFNRYIGMELSYMDFGTYSLNATDLANGISVSESDRISALSIAAVAYEPLDRGFAVFGKFGLAAGTDSETCSVTGTPCSPHSSSGINPMIGLGARLQLSREMSLNVEYDEYSDIGNSYWEYTAGNFTALNVSALYRF